MKTLVPALRSTWFNMCLLVFSLLVANGAHADDIDTAITAAQTNLEGKATSLATLGIGVALILGVGYMVARCFKRG